MEDEQQQATTGSSSVDAITARREARRKRILENSNNRLTKITGREHSESPTVKPPDVIYPDPEDERDVYQHAETIPISTDVSFPSQNGDILSLLNTLSQAQSNGGVPGAGLQLGADTATAPPVEETRLVKFLRTKVHIAVTAIIIYLLFATDQQHLIGSNVFLLLLGWEIIEVFLLKTYETRASFLDVVFLLGGISKQYSQIIVKFTQTVNKVLKDVAFFVFFFVLTHLTWSRLVLGIEFAYVLGYDRLEKEQVTSA